MGEWSEKKLCIGRGKTCKREHGKMKCRGDELEDGDIERKERVLVRRRNGGRMFHINSTIFEESNAFRSVLEQTSWVQYHNITTIEVATLFERGLVNKELLLIYRCNNKSKETHSKTHMGI